MYFMFTIKPQNMKNVILGMYYTRTIHYTGYYQLHVHKGKISILENNSNRLLVVYALFVMSCSRQKLTRFTKI